MSEQREQEAAESVLGEMILGNDRRATKVIRTYGDERHAAGYQQAIADVVEWLGDEFPHDIAIRAKITQRFGKDA